MISTNKQIDKSHFCFNAHEKSSIELVRVANRDKNKRDVYTNEIIFIVKGKGRILFNDFSEHFCEKGDMLFLPSGKHYLFLALEATEIIVFRIYSAIWLSENFSLTNTKGWIDTRQHACSNSNLGKLQIHNRIGYLLRGIHDCLLDKIQCQNYFDLKIREFFILLYKYYSQEEINGFLILNTETAFKEYVRFRGHLFYSVKEFAESLGMSPRQFSTQFKATFGKTVYKWMKEQRAKIIYTQLLSSNNPIKQVAFENGFSTVSQFSKFCKKELGKTPSDIRLEKSSDLEKLPTNM